MLVKIQGPPKGIVEDLLLRITATSDSDTLADRDIEVGPMNSVGNYYAACWLDDTGCEPITVVVELAHGEELQRKIAMIPFECSE